MKGFEEEETWEQIPEFPGYEFSSRGKLRSVWVFRGKGWAASTYVNSGVFRELMPRMTGNGYFRVVLLHASGVRQDRWVHSMILWAFRGPRPDGWVSRHLDGNKTNNCIENLMWGTASENMLDAVRHGKPPRGKATPTSIKEEILRHRRDGKSITQVADCLGVSKSTVWEACNPERRRTIGVRNPTRELSKFYKVVINRITKLHFCDSYCGCAKPDRLWHYPGGQRTAEIPAWVPDWMNGSDSLTVWQWLFDMGKIPTMTKSTRSGGSAPAKPGS